MTAFAAQNETWLIDYDEFTPPLPLIGWVHTTGLNVSPLVIGHPGPLVSGEGFLLHTGQVFDPWSSTMHESADAWRESLTENTIFRPGQVISTLAPPVDLVIRQPAAPTVPLERHVPETTKVAIPAGTITWSERTFKTKSFWHVTGPVEFVFSVEGENAVPKPTATVQKITRDQFYELRKTVGERSPKPDDEPELPLDPTPSAEDDDIDDMI